MPVLLSRDNCFLTDLISNAPSFAELQSPSMAQIRMSAALAAFTVVLALSSFPQGDAFGRSLKLNRTGPAVTLLPGGFAPLNASEYENPQVQQIVNFTLDAIASKTVSTKHLMTHLSLLVGIQESYVIF